MDAYPTPRQIKALKLFGIGLVCFIAGILISLIVGWFDAHASERAPQDELLGVAQDKDGAMILFFSAPPAAMPGCKGGEARKIGHRVGCWVAIEEEAVFFVMWSHGDISNVHQSEVRFCNVGSLKAKRCLP